MTEGISIKSQYYYCYYYYFIITVTHAPPPPAPVVDECVHGVWAEWLGAAEAVHAAHAVDPPGQVHPRPRVWLAVVDGLAHQAVQGVGHLTAAAQRKPGRGGGGVREERGGRRVRDGERERGSEGREGVTGGRGGWGVKGERGVSHK